MKDLKTINDVIKYIEQRKGFMIAYKSFGGKDISKREWEFAGRVIDIERTKIIDILTKLTQ